MTLNYKNIQTGLPDDIQIIHEAETLIDKFFFDPDGHYINYINIL
jgi:hypothetical protein